MNIKHENIGTFNFLLRKRSDASVQKDSSKAANALSTSPIAFLPSVLYSHTSKIKKKQPVLWELCLGFAKREQKWTPVAKCLARTQ